MTKRNTEHSSLVVERTYPFAVAKVWKAWADPAAKAKWFSGPADQWTLIERSCDFRVGGTETASGTFKQGFTSHFKAHYLDIVENQRIIYSYGMHLDDRKISESLACIELVEVAGGTKLTVTEHGIFLDGYEDKGSRLQGTEGLMDALSRSLS
jgi:uncharacterized protein YndB with AHSA1/START domain